MRPEKPDHSCSRKAFIGMVVCFLIVAMGYTNDTLGFISALAIVPVYVLPVYGIIKRKKENKAFQEEIKKYDAQLKIQVEEPEKLKRN